VCDRLLEAALKPTIRNLSLLSLYCQQAGSASAPNSLVAAPSNSTSSPSSAAEKRESYDLVDSLLHLSRSEDGRVAVKACEGLLLLVSTPHEAAAKATVQDTALCPLLNTRHVGHSVISNVDASLV